MLISFSCKDKVPVGQVNRTIQFHQYVYYATEKKNILKTLNRIVQDKRWNKMARILLYYKYSKVTKPIAQSTKFFRLSAMAAYGASTHQYNRRLLWLGLHFVRLSTLVWRLPFTNVVQPLHVNRNMVVFRYIPTYVKHYFVHCWLSSSFDTIYQPPFHGEAYVHQCPVNGCWSDTNHFK